MAVFDQTPLLDSTCGSSLPSSPNSSKEAERPPLSQSVVRSIEIVKAIKQGHPSDESWIKLQLQPGDYERLMEQLEAEDLLGFVEDKVRIDYSSNSHQLVIRMPDTPIHAILTADVVYEIRSQLRQIAAATPDTEISAIANSVQHCGSCRIFLDGYVRRCPDGSFRSPDASFRRLKEQYPCLIIETASSKKSKDLHKLAQDYILGSHGNVKMVVGLDVKYPDSRIATVSVWRPDGVYNRDSVPNLRVKNTIKSEVFRSADMSLLSKNAALDIPMSIFSQSPSSARTTISIPYKTLSDFLEVAIDSQAVMEQRRNHPALQKPPPSTPTSYGTTNGRANSLTALNPNRRGSRPYGSLSPASRYLTRGLRQSKFRPAPIAATALAAVAVAAGRLSSR
ncbi:hypothetical protein FGG08_007208 [Glutinoglossum americanum]|uniref:Uncharacterized protein n=1 Tax=Glutinoglossum americanum TaxID=1670608 RepID=A0A9P8HWS8_9PEZI|nr:hypothetical protein FGG08_007208 [Glutinoglossum americanum]